MVSPVVLLVLLICGTTAASPPLLLQVEWILQGFDWSFTGFFVEFMGLARALRDEFPFINVQRSSFRTRSSIEDGANYPSSDFVADLFEEESYLLRYLANRTVSVGSQAAAPAPRSLFMPPFVAAEDACRPGSEDFNEGVQVIGGDLSRSALTSLSSHACCEACLSLPICLAWSFDLGASECRLKGSVPTITVASPLHSSGIIRGSLSAGSPSAGKPRVQPPKALILHGTTCLYKNESFASGGLAKRDINTILIGRFMLERSAFSNGLDINEFSVLSCASIVDEIWVPTEWGVGVMRSLLAMASVANKRIAVVPEAVDTRLFDPVLASHTAREERLRRGDVPASCQWLSTAEMKDENAEGKVAVAVNGAVHAISGEGAPRLSCPQPPSFSSSSSSSSRSKFEFLSIFKWERRKGWDILLRAYFRAFGPQDDVRLRLRTYVPSFLGGDINITSRIEEFALAATGLPLQQLAEVVWERGTDEARRENGMSRGEVRDLYYLADCFVLPTRGEGWGLPVAEAMAMGLPVIVTNYSGPAAYATEENSYPL